MSAVGSIFVLLSRQSWANLTAKVDKGRQLHPHDCDEVPTCGQRAYSNAKVSVKSRAGLRLRPHELLAPPRIRSSTERNPWTAVVHGCSHPPYSTLRSTEAPIDDA